MLKDPFGDQQYLHMYILATTQVTTGAFVLDDLDKDQ